MKKTACLILMLVLCASLIPNSFADTGSFSDDPKAIQAASNSVVMLSCYDKDGNKFATGSAFAAFDDGVFVTNFHVIEDVYSIRAQMETGLEFRIDTVVAYDTEKDIAILRTDAKTGLEPLPLGDSSKLERAEKVIAIGSPLRLINTISIGLYSGIIKDDGVFLQFSAPISQGSSGGALFNNIGEVVGITSASYTKGQNLNLAIPIDDVKALYKKADTTKQISLSEFYNSLDHTPPIPTLTVDYVLKHCEELDGQKLCIEGYIGYIDNTLKKAYLVRSSEDIFDLQKASQADGSLNHFYRIALQHGSIVFHFDETNTEIIHSKQKDKSPLMIEGVFSVEYSGENQYLSAYPAYVLTTIDSSYQDNSIGQKSLNCTYTVDYVMDHYIELDEQEFSIEGYVTYVDNVINQMYLCEKALGRNPGTFDYLQKGQIIIPYDGSYTSKLLTARDKGTVITVHGVFKVEYQGNQTEPSFTMINCTFD